MCRQPQHFIFIQLIHIISTEIGLLNVANDMMPILIIQYFWLELLPSILNIKFTKESAKLKSVTLCRIESIACARHTLEVVFIFDDENFFFIYNRKIFHCTMYNVHVTISTVKASKYRLLFLKHIIFSLYFCLKYVRKNKIRKRITRFAIMDFKH